MANMSYCMFRNTLAGLNQCFDALSDDTPLSEEEALNARELIELCHSLAESFDADDIVLASEEDEE